MTKKCESCYFYDQKQGSEFCKRMMPEMPISVGRFIDLDIARDLCDALIRTAYGWPEAK